MKLAILQPCFFPYEGYYKIVEGVDHVIFLNDAPFTSKAWLNKTILDINGKPYFYRIPIENKKMSTNQLTNEIKCSLKWKRKFLKIIRSGYHRCPNFKNGYPLIEEIINLPTDQLSDLASYSIYRTHEFMNVQKGNRAPSNTKFSLSSVRYKEINTFLPEKILTICKKERAKELIALPYMKSLFDFQEYKKYGIRVKFIGTNYNKFSIINKLLCDKNV